MSVFDKKLKKSGGSDLPIDPIELQKRCDYKERYEYLRSIQTEVLTAWHAKRKQRDVICKMNTGSGKTLTGLLMLYSKMIELKEPVLYVCPDKQLTEQTIEQAVLYGIPVCWFESREMPSEFLNGKAVLVCNFYKFFNGRSVFIRENVKLGAIVIDDAHKCVDIARAQASLSFPREHEVGKKLFAIFEVSLRKQLPGSYTKLRDGDPQLSMKVPYWSWFDEQDKVLTVINDYVKKLNTAAMKAKVAGEEVSKEIRDDDTPLRWAWIADHLQTYDCFIGGTSIEIDPMHVPYQHITPFHEAKHRFVLSATFEDDYDLIRDLGISLESIKNPIVPTDRTNIGKRLILTPQRFDAKILDKEMRDFVAKYPAANHNVVVLVPSKEAAAPWRKLGAKFFTTDDIPDAIKELNKSKGNFYVFANRYDGIDLAGNACRILVLDGLPKYNTMREYYTETRLESLRAGKKAQIIEQGLGRAVRSGADYCVVYIMGADLLGFLGLERNIKHFTPVTRAQVQLGLRLLEDEDNENSLETIEETAQYCLKQHTKWTQYHNQEMEEIEEERIEGNKLFRLQVADAERNALREFRQRNYIAAGEIILRQVVDQIEEQKHREKGWYLQLAAQLFYLGDPALANEFQSKACLNLDSLLHPQLGHTPNKAISKGAQPSLVKKRIGEFDKPQDIMLYLNRLVASLVYSPEQTAIAFERALAELGEFLGFNAKMPDADTGDGPDGLWAMSDGHFLVLEAKSRRTGDEISKDNIEQLAQSELWFKEHYGSDAPYTAVSLQPSSKRGRNVRVDGQTVLDQEHLQLLHDNLIKFGATLQSVHPLSHAEQDIAKHLNSFKLTPALFRATYLTAIR